MIGCGSSVHADGPDARARAVSTATAVRLVSRNNVDHSKRFPDLIAAVAALPSRTLAFEGEVAVFDKQLSSGSASSDLDAVATAPLLTVFDLMYRSGGDLRDSA
jgi:bifunctional non-homologous end joining protein LigD